MENSRPYFTFFRSFFEAIDDCPERVQLELYRAIALYGLNKTEPGDLDPISKPLWKLIKPNLDKMWTKFDNGRKGGAPAEAMKGNQNARRQTENKPNSNLIQTENKTTLSEDKDKDKDKDKKNTPNGVILGVSRSLSLSDRQKAFYDELVPYVDKYGRETIRAFYDYWSEPNQAGTKMNRELQPTWDTGKRLARWVRNERTTSKAAAIPTQADQQRKWYREDQERQAREQEERERSKAEAVTREEYLKMKKEGKI